jgi:hypothetical protein
MHTFSARNCGAFAHNTFVYRHLLVSHHGLACEYSGFGTKIVRFSTLLPDEAGSLFLV